MLEKRKFLSNSVSLITTKLGQGISTFVLTAVIARTLGTEALGQYVLGISFFYIFVNLASQCLKTLFTREISRNLQSTPLYLINGLVLQLILCIISYLTLLLVIFLLPYNYDTSLVCYIIGLAVIPFGLSNITESILQAQEKMYIIAISNVPVYILRVILIVFSISNLNYDLPKVGLIYVISEVVIFVIQWIFVTREIKPKWQIDVAFIQTNVRKLWTFIGIEGMGIFANKVDILLLSLLGSEILIGIYGGMKQMLQPFFIVSNSVSLAGFPKLSKAATSGKSVQKEVAENIISVLLMMSIPFFISIVFLGQELLTLVYKDPNFQGVGLIFNMLAISVIISSFSRTFNYLLTANGYERFLLLEVLITTVVATLSGIFLITEYKLIGAGLMVVARGLVHFSVLATSVYIHIFSINLWKVFRLPLLVGAFIVGVLLILKYINLSLIPSMVIVTLSYILFIAILGIKLFGGLGNARKKLL